jgi:hypothetical protein
MEKVVRIQNGVSNSWLATPYQHSYLSCGHVAQNGVPAVGELVECDSCAKSRIFIDSIDLNTVFRARFDPRFSPGHYHLYKRDTTSPSGVMLIGSVTATPEFDNILAKRNISPLSPTER